MSVEENKGQDDKKSEQLDSGFAFSSYRPQENASDTEASASEVESSPQNSISGKKTTNWLANPLVIATVFGLILIVVVVSSTSLFLNKKKHVEKIEETKQEAPTRDTQAEYKRLSSQIDDLLSTPGADDDRLYGLARERFAIAEELGEADKMIKSADFAAAMADRLKLPEDALRFYDLHTLISADAKILEAKFRIYQRYHLNPTHNNEIELYKANSQIVAACDELASDLRPPVQDMEGYLNLLRYYQNQRKQLASLETTKSAYVSMLKAWLWQQKELNVLSRLKARQEGKHQILALDLDLQRPESQIKQVGTVQDFESCAVYKTRQWIPLDFSPGVRSYLDSENAELLIFKNDENGNILAVRIISLAAARGDAFADKIIDLACPLIYGCGADEIADSSEVLRNRLALSTESNALTIGQNTVLVLCSKQGKLVGFEIRKPNETAWPSDLSIEKVLVQGSKDKKSKQKYQSICYLSELPAEQR